MCLKSGNLNIIKYILLISFTSVFQTVSASGRAWGRVKGKEKGKTTLCQWTISYTRRPAIFQIMPSTLLRYQVKRRKKKELRKVMTEWYCHLIFPPSFPSHPSLFLMLLRSSTEGKWRSERNWAGEIIPDKAGGGTNPFPLLLFTYLLLCYIPEWLMGPCKRREI